MDDLSDMYGSPPGAIQAGISSLAGVFRETQPAANAPGLICHSRRHLATGDYASMYHFLIGENRTRHVLSIMHANDIMLMGWPQDCCLRRSHEVLYGRRRRKKHAKARFPRRQILDKLSAPYRALEMRVNLGYTEV